MAEPLRLAHRSVFSPLFNRWIAIYRAISMGGGEIDKQVIYGYKTG